MSMGTKYDKGDRQGMTAAKTFSAPPGNIIIVAGHNYRKIDQERVNMFAQMYLDKKDVPPILVALGDNDELELVDGEHRVRAALQAGIPKVAMMEFSGTKEERLAAAWRFNQGSKGTPTENAVAFLRMRNNGWSNARIAKETGASEGTVANHLLLAMCGQEVLDMVDAGDVAATPVVNLARSLGPDKVLATLREAKKESEAAADKPESAAAPTKKADGAKFKSRKERVTEKRLRRVQEKVADESAERRARVYLKTLMAHLPEVMVVGDVDVNKAPASQSITLTCPAGSWRELSGMREVILDYLSKQAKGDK